MTETSSIAARLNEGLALHRAGRLDEAERVYRAVLAQAPRNNDALNLLGVIAQARGARDEALSLYAQAIDAAPQAPSPHFNKAVALAEAGRIGEAAAAYRKAITLKPDYADARLNLGVLLHAQNDLPAAIAAFQEMTTRCPGDLRGYFNLGRCLNETRDYAGAERALKVVLKHQPGHADAQVSLAKVYAATDRLSEAIALLQSALKLKTADAELFSTLGGWLQQAGDFDGARAAHRRACDLAPTRAEFYFNFGNMERAADRLDDALRLFTKAVELNPNFANAYINLGQTQHDMELLDEALASFDKAFALEPEQALGRTKRSAALTNKGIALLSQGRFAEAWPLYRFRFDPDINAARARSFPYPPWQGEPLAGKTILLWTDQGIGDEVMGSSMIPEIIAQAGTCIVECAERLVPLFTRSFPAAKVLPALPQPLPEIDALKPNYQSSLIDLAEYLRPTAASFAGRENYLKADPQHRKALADKYRALAGGRKIVGLSWRSKAPKNGAAKTAPLAAWEPILKTPGVFFVSLQYGATSEELATISAQVGVSIYQDNSVDAWADLDGLTAQIGAMDLVISVSNTTVHLAGAQGQAVWTMVHAGVGVLWYFRSGERAIWYPSVRLFRQSAPGDWNSVIGRLADELGRFAAHGGHAS
ncbi:MAG: tetratricopeptide repeat protein [Rhodospirillaceae bacterium]|nr:tetratricopeptide repeat protein [Rhodospirillaceae bacterium]